jgi:hypothetical protein
MILISHRGNINGRIPEQENHPDYIIEALSQGYDVEVDVWYVNGEFYLGHDEPQYKTNKIFLSHNCLWVHCKNVEALDKFKFDNINYFWHENDTVTLTSKRNIWAYPGKQPIKGSVAVLPELYNDNVEGCYGVCSDYIENYK